MSGLEIIAVFFGTFLVCKVATRKKKPQPGQNARRKPDSQGIELALSKLESENFHTEKAYFEKLLKSKK